MWRTILSLMIGGTAMFLIGSQITVGQQAPGIKRTDLLKTALPETEGKDMNPAERFNRPTLTPDAEVCVCD
jgi:hypothetical protein